MTQSPDPTESHEPTDPTVFGETRAQWEAHLGRMHGASWVEAQRGFLDTEWAHLLERWGDQRDPNAPLTADPNPNFTA